MKKLVFIFAMLFLLTGCQAYAPTNVDQEDSATNLSGSSSGGPTDGVQ